MHHKDSTSGDAAPGVVGASLGWASSLLLLAKPHPPPGPVRSAGGIWAWETFPPGELPATQGHRHLTSRLSPEDV